MNIFYTDINNFPQEKIYNFIKTSNLSAEYSDKYKLLQHYSGLYLVHYIAETFYKTDNPIIVYKNKKPYFQNSDLYFSVSHSKNITGVAFDKQEIGFDIEYNKAERNFSAILKKILKKTDAEVSENFDTKQPEIQHELFYRLWTQYEAKIKLHTDNQNVCFHTNILCNDFTYSVAAENPIFLNKIIVLDE